jgi:hypothetical protein
MPQTNRPIGTNKDRQQKSEATNKIEKYNAFTDSAVIIGEGDPNLSPTAGKPLI